MLVEDSAARGVSMGVATGSLRKAGVRSVRCVAIGKFGGQLGCYDIELKSDPFQPIAAGEWSESDPLWVEELQSAEDQEELRRLLLE